MLSLQIKLMILILLSEVRNLQNMIKLPKTVTTIIIVIIMKTVTKIKVVMIIKLIALRRHQPQKKLFSYLETAW